eukprot:TRINITY_DN6443_c0_g1_i1.p1 TRINITY_DN6443_c0_g1~~TRINITY_DN6443_c0_g1_i1.p1  ORF type:complete len:304 (+),score=68.99 TRINITY_DN6443_c0_g1_i1:273-1184(+)
MASSTPPQRRVRVPLLEYDAAPAAAPAPGPASWVRPAQGARWVRGGAPPRSGQPRGYAAAAPPPPARGDLELRHPPPPKEGRAFWRAVAVRARTAEYLQSKRMVQEGAASFVIELADAAEPHEFQAFDADAPDPETGLRVIVPSAPHVGPYMRAGVGTGWLKTFNGVPAESLSVVTGEMEAMRQAGVTSFPIEIEPRAPEAMQDQLFDAVADEPVVTTVALREPLEKHAFQMAARDGGEGVRIIGTGEGGAYHRAGVPLGLLVSIGGHPVASSQDALAAIAALQERGATDFPVAVRPNVERVG